MLSMYPACFFREENGYSVIFPDLNLATCGETVQEAMSMAVDCLAGRLHLLKQDGDPIPEPSDMNSIDLTAVSRESISFLWMWKLMQRSTLINL